MPDRILFIDTETGGIEPQIHSLLSIGLVVWEQSRIIAEKEIFINDGILNVTSSALSINQIDIDKHIKQSVSPKESVSEIYEFINLYFDNTEKIILGGHNVNFDKEFLKFFFKKQGEDFNFRFSHRSIDTASILYFLYFSGIIKEKAISSDDAFNLFSIEIEKRHSALSDAKATAKLFTVLLGLV